MTLLTLPKHRPQDEENYYRADKSAAKPFGTCASKQASKKIVHMFFL
jgi:hypothetical protein